ncbi:MAG: alpha/beta hydrolase [Acidimicrobiales bacterium]
MAGWLLGFYFSASGSGSGSAPPMVPGTGSMATIARGGRMRDRFAVPDGPLEWLTAEDLAFYASGFSGGLNRYRNVDRDFEDLAVHAHRPITVPALFIGAARTARRCGVEAIAAFDRTLPRLHRSIILDGCGHWTQQERPREVNEALLSFVSAVSPR